MKQLPDPEKLSFRKRVKESGNPSEKWKVIKEMSPSGDQDQFKLKEKYFYCNSCKEQQSEKRFSCSQCDKDFAKLDELKSHKMEHVGEKPFSCSQCGKDFANLDELKNHEPEHSSEKPHSCSQCDKFFANSEELKTHEREHASEKQFSCSQCDKDFANQDELKSHEKEHSSKKPYSCSQCDKGFANSDELKSHELEHPSEKPFSCSKCDKVFTSENELSKHTNDELFSCKICEKMFAECDLTAAEELVESDRELAEIMNKYFPLKIETIERKIPKFDIDPTARLKKKLTGKKLHFSFSPVTEAEVKKAIKSLKPKKSSGLDFVPPTIIKLAVDVITTPLTWIINSSLQSGEFPSIWKSAKVSPIYKNKGSRLSKTFYRPVSNLIAASKVIEQIVNRRVLNFFESNGLFPQSQHGFRQKRSTFSAVASMHERWLKAKEEKSHQAVAFLDLSAAFDTLSKDIVCKKLKCYGFDDTSVKWFDSYLSERQQSVMIGSTISESTTLKVGSPQGAILSPTVFIILISDMELYCPEAELCGYADDTTVSVAAKNLDAVKDKCESAVNKLLVYMAINKLSCNDDKTHVLVMKHGQVDRTLTFNIGEAKIKESKDEKLLGVWVSNDLKWTHHIEKLESSLRLRLYSLRKMEQKIPRSELKDIADSIFGSILRYAICLYCPIRIKESDPAHSSINAIRVVYNDLLRLLCKSKRKERKPIKEMLEELGWLSLNQMCCEVRLIEVWKSLNLDNYCLKNLFEKVNSRNHNRIRLKSEFKSRLRESSFHYPSVQIWNTAPQSITNANSESQARKAIRDFVKTLPV